MIWSKIVANFNISNTRSNRPSSVFFDILGVILAASHWSYQGYLKSLREQILDFLLESWRRHQMETFSALLVPGEFPTQRPVARSFDVFFDLCPNKRLSTQSWGWWSETPSHSFWRHSYASRMRHVTLGLYSLSCKTSYRQISWSLEAARLDVAMVVSLWNLTGTSAAALPRYLPNFRAIGKF